jgi:hypothetical protein
MKYNLTPPHYVCPFSSRFLSAPTVKGIKPTLSTLNVDRIINNEQFWQQHQNPTVNSYDGVFDCSAIVSEELGGHNNIK